jgi:hypothetical protein
MKNIKIIAIIIVILLWLLCCESLIFNVYNWGYNAGYKYGQKDATIQFQTNISKTIDSVLYVRIESLRSQIEPILDSIEYKKYGNK